MKKIESIEMPNILPEIKYIDISNEEYKKIMDMFSWKDLNNDLKQPFVNRRSSMRNVAKCKLCHNVIESKSELDYVACGCGEIYVSGGTELMRCGANDWKNFVRVDDQGNEIIPSIQNSTEKDIIDPSNRQNVPTKSELLKMFDEFIKSIETLPQIAMNTSINHYDLLSVLMLISAIFRSDCKDDS